MSKDYSVQIAEELKIAPSKVAATTGLLDDGSTVPFISRYRKEITGNLDEVEITNIRDRLTQLRDLDKRRAAILASIKEQGKLTKELEAKIIAAKTMAVIEDIYLPYKPKRRTKATVAKEKGLEPLAKSIFEQKGIDVGKEAVKYVNAKLKVDSAEAAIAGARDIIAEWINENAQARAQLRLLFQEQAVMRSKVVRGKEAEGNKYKDYFEWEEPAKNAPSHRILAVRRGEKETFLMVRILPPEEPAVEILGTMFIKGKGEDSGHVQTALEDSYKRLLSPSLETEIRLELKKRADKDAIDIFKNNLRQLLMSSPLGQKNVLAIDPGLRTGCKVVCLDRQGKLLKNETIYLVMSESQKEESAETIKSLCKKYNTEVIAIGNGTASRETEAFIKSIGLPKEISVVMVSESGASIYSASDVAREEFPDHDVTVRGAVSIGRRLMDPLAELVKIDPKSIGVGQYQHDVDQALLKECLSDTVISCVNQVGVEVNTASKQLLMYVSGLGPSRAQAIIDFRNANGPFKLRSQISAVTGLGAKAYEQAAGFLRINDGEDPLDSSAVHPESYYIVEAMARDLNCTVRDLIVNEKYHKKIDLRKYVTDSTGLPTLQDIKSELAKPGRDPREPFQIFSFKEGVERIEDLSPGMKLPGVITNITAFGAFVDIGVHHDGLVHISQLSDRFVKDPHDIIKVHQKVDVTVLEVDRDRKRIALTMKKM
ncbi:MAG: RNA-binding transcriptional accessory protein [Omnitrophica WOR_2 bacterium RIFOXYB2_FULL_38_16]|nr:MAG: RNA-binding transcriptional accessory protein [Omnitrophica WOR_2 bacterium RIFOXYA2_FULL_38_17]OGX51921.1 MAG: RNA-binding transcriptional accessory protein [Omnitrophica WOR_2 bacterium RIFOXYA12_FULL_38_10]OGX59391.1 MAG: RNA-binding transcriptional accessory protein [Omnitrophica WOR_2 bacterium RIFOXYB2_FULL_38_16]